ncbi:unnamed protein product [Symbiodinium natans]|uniref:Pentatricopeptide repeat-containing protein, chloroplastic n=1 Tax=Symbiodinium natans TaxID=878477 RepID=A0A812LVL2_9DINO|nr:unnamed protein product [Symbiodinium natans]
MEGAVGGVGLLREPAKFATRWAENPKELSALLNRLANGGGDVFRALHQLRKANVPLNVVHVNVAIKAARSSWPLALQVLCEAPDLTVDPDVVSFNSVISACRASWPCALALLESMEAKRVAATEVSYSSAINACSDAWEVAVELLKTMHEDALLPYVVAFGAAINACARAGQGAAARELLQEIGQRRLQVNEIAFNSAISACEKAGDWEEAAGLLWQMSERRMSADVVSHNAVISAFEKAGQWERAIQQLQVMSHEKVIPDTISYNALISACGRAGQWEVALEVLARRLWARRADVHGVTAALSALGQAKLWPRVLALLEDIDSVSLRPTSAVCNAAIGACDAAGQWQRALLLLGSMPRHNIQADRISRVTAISACGQASKWQLALSLYSSADGPSGVAAAASACGNASQWARALVMIDSLPRASLDEVSYGVAIRACQEPRKWQLAVHLLEEMCSQALRANAICISAAVVAAKEAWPAALALLRLAPSEAGYGAAVRACQEAGEWAAALALLTECRRSINQDNLAVTTLTLSACAQVRQWQQVLSLAELLCADAAECEASELGPALSVALAECEVRSLTFVERRLLRHLGRRDLDTAASELLRLSGAWRRDRFPLAAARAALQAPAAAASARSYHREVGLLRKVFDEAQPGDVEAIVQTLDHFGEDLEWAKFAGKSKGKAIVAALCGAAPSKAASSPRNLGILEIGTYCGNSALRLAAALPGVPLTSLELDPVCVAVARCLLGFAGLSARVQVWTGHSRLLLPTLKSRLQPAGDSESWRFGALLVDRWGTEYDEDLDLVEQHQLLLENGGLIVADNVLSTAAAQYLWRTSALAGGMPEGCGGPGGMALCYTSQVVSVQEVADSSQEDWVSVAVSSGRRVRSDRPAQEIPEELAELNRLSMCLRPRVVGPSGNQVAAVEMPQLAVQAKAAFKRANLGPVEWPREGEKMAREKGLRLPPDDVEKARAWDVSPST